MLILKEGETVHQMVAEGSTFRLPDGSWISPAELGWTDGVYELVEFIPPAIPEVDPRVDMPRLTPLQFRLGLIMAGISLETIDLAIASIEDAQERKNAELHWQFAQEYERLNPFVVNLSAGLGLTPEQVDDMWSAVLSG